jgi:hypothetical protein
MYYVVDILGVLSVEFAEGGGDPVGVVVAGPFDGEREANLAYINLWAEQATGSEIIGH